MSNAETPNTGQRAADVTRVSLIRGGPIYWVENAPGEITSHGWTLGTKLLIGIAAAWVPLVVLTAVHGASDLRELLTDYRVYARALIAIPLLILAQGGLEWRFHEMPRYFLEANLIRVPQLGRFDEIMQKAARWRAAKWPFVAIIVLVLLDAGYMLESGRLKNATWATDPTTGAITAAGYYSTLVAQGVFLALLGLILWKWLTWLRVLRDISKLDLQLDATDADSTGGLGFLGEIPKAFIPVLLALSTVVGASWRDQVLAGQVDLKSLAMPAALLAVLTLSLFFAPLLVFTPKLLKCKREGAIEYGTLRHLHSLEFRKKWVDERRAHIEEFLGSRDLTSLSGITSGFRNVEEMRVFPFRADTLVGLLTALALPLIPVVTTEIPLQELLKKLFEALH
jgi:hypothetical protein